MCDPAQILKNTIYAVTRKWNYAMSEKHRDELAEAQMHALEIAGIIYVPNYDGSTSQWQKPNSGESRE